MQEKRKTSRLLRQEQTIVEHGSDKKQVTLLDISIGGMRVKLNEELKVGTILTLKANILPHAGAFFLRGSVAWVKAATSGHFETGVTFTKISTIPF